MIDTIDMENLVAWLAVDVYTSHFEGDQRPAAGYRLWNMIIMSVPPHSQNDVDENLVRYFIRLL